MQGLVMAKGSTIQLHFHHFSDPHTGARITRLTPPDVICHRNYFYQKALHVTAVNSCLLLNLTVIATITCWTGKNRPPFNLHTVVVTILSVAFCRPTIAAFIT